MAVKSNHFLGAILLISGTTLGVGMLAFPTMGAFSGFFPSLIFFVAIWLLMLCSGIFFLDAHLAIKEETNMVSMAEKSLGLWGKIVSWVIYLLLLYSLTAAYIAGCTPFFVDAIRGVTGYTLPAWLAPFCLPVIFGGFVYFGTSGVDLINRLLMIGLAVSYIVLVVFVPEQIEADNLMHWDFSAGWIAVPVIFTAFGYHIIIPSLSNYLKRDRKRLLKAIVVGSFIPICIYLLWQFLVLGAVPISDLVNAYKEGVSASIPLAKVLRNPWIGLAANFFAFFAIVTSFIGVTLSLSDFLTDGFKIKRSLSGRFLAIILTFIPPLFFVFTYKRGFYIALQYAGAFVAILLVFLPAAMAWQLKKYKTVPKRILLIVVISAAIGIVGLDIAEELGALKPLIEQYLK